MPSEPHRQCASRPSAAFVERPGAAPPDALATRALARQSGRRRRFAAPRRALARARGLSLIEVLVTLVITAIGMLGLAGLQMATVRYNHTAYLRSTATQLVGDLADRMRANYVAAVDTTGLPYVSALTWAGAAAPAAGSAPACAAPCSGTPRADRDLWEWRRRVGLMLPDGRASVSGTPAGRYAVVLMWNETGDRAANLAEWGTSGCPAALAAPAGVRCFQAELLP